MEMMSVSKFFGKMAGYICAVLFFSFFSDATLAQSKQPTQKDIDALNLAVKKYPTADQKNELNAIMNKFNKKFEVIKSSVEDYGDRLNKIGELPGYPLSAKDIEDCISIHNHTREVFLNTVDDFSKWGVKSKRQFCVRQSAVHKDFFQQGSAYFMANIHGLPLATAGERAASALWITLGAGFGGPMSLVPDVDERLKYSGEILGLYVVCLGGDEYVPGTK